MSRCLVFAILLGAGGMWAVSAAGAEPERLRGERFIDVMQGNTLSGTAASGAEFNVYFLPGGFVSYEDSGGKRDHGRWQLDPDGDVCLRWMQDKEDHCFAVTVEGDEVSWKGKGGQAEGMLRGGVGSTYLKSK